MRIDELVITTCKTMPTMPGDQYFDYENKPIMDVSFNPNKLQVEHISIIVITGSETDAGTVALMEFLQLHFKPGKGVTVFGMRIRPVISYRSSGIAICPMMPADVALFNGVLQQQATDA